LKKIFFKLLIFWKDKMSLIMQTSSQACSCQSQPSCLLDIVLSILSRRFEQHHSMWINQSMTQLHQTTSEVRNSIFGHVMKPTLDCLLNSNINWLGLSISNRPNQESPTKLDRAVWFHSQGRQSSFQFHKNEIYDFRLVLVPRGGSD